MFGFREPTQIRNPVGSNPIHRANQNTVDIIKYQCILILVG